MVQKIEFSFHFILLIVISFQMFLCIQNKRALHNAYYNYIRSNNSIIVKKKSFSDRRKLNIIFSIHIASAVQRNVQHVHGRVQSNPFFLPFCFFYHFRWIFLSVVRTSRTLLLPHHIPYLISFASQSLNKRARSHVCLRNKSKVHATLVRFCIGSDRLYVFSYEN